MPQFLLELFSEEIPARMQKKAAEDLKKLLMDALSKAGFLPAGIETFSAPRRLVAVVEGLPERTADVREERKGPRTDAPTQAIEGFLRGAGLSDISQARVVNDPKKGDFYVADLVKPGRATPDALAEIVPDIIRNFPWPKSMRWGEGSLRWVRPLHRILAVFDGQIVPFEVDGIAATNISEGHRFHGTGPFEVKDFDDYEAKLTAAHVVLDRDERKARIKADAITLCQARNLELIEDEGLLEEVCGLVDEPHVIMGDMDKAFLDLPPEVIRLTLRVNQKYFVVRDPATGGLAPHFIIVSNVKARDGGQKIAAGNARVLAARLNDARYFWDLDRKASLESRVPKLDTLVFHEKLGSVGDKVRRIAALAGEIAPLVGADVAIAQQAALLAKADLTTEMVGEFPELQGVMGRYYQLHEAVLRRATGEGDLAQQGGGGIAPSVGFADSSPASQGSTGLVANKIIADAIRDHYKPVGPSDQVPSEPVAMAVALADKLDTLTGFFAIGEKPTGSGDPFALRRAALGVIRIVRGANFCFSLNTLLRKPTARIDIALYNALTELKPALPKVEESRLSFLAQKAEDFQNFLNNPNNAGIDFKNSEYGKGLSSEEAGIVVSIWQTREAVVDFILERLRVALRDEGFAPDVLEAAFAIEDDDINRIVARVTALAGFLKTEDGTNLTAGIKRASNILAAEAKKGALPSELSLDPALCVLAEEQALQAALAEAQNALPDLVGQQDFDSAMRVLASLRAPVDAFFEAVLVNDPDPAKRLNRLALLTAFKHAASQVADFSKLAG
ncbi:glycine-tRNA ligase beta subunit [Candidatus Phycosocius bacilliformis]|uniref:Glycine--tRNA ligase beta subunit n=1 Tax=Candidatus Phycosocius bacilliformis TaxID=1445552 RepID=A0A2P2EE97_9PROT|nr:glycine--tRNA ligase subunit beta [Candidatus Phycosocius bacilliformis]GBF59376.1 glycine-tRNA ligase beta subunit [Candidatus Phycosocius bacilliformis]